MKQYQLQSCEIHRKAWQMIIVQQSASLFLGFHTDWQALCDSLSASLYRC
jgi:hypothetical protein